MEKETRQPLPKILRILLLGSLLFLLVAIITVTPLGNDLEARFGLDLMFKLRGALSPPTEVAVIAIDKTSTDTLNLPRQLDRWSRSHYAELIDTVNQLGAEVVAFDILFSEPRDTQGDRRLSQSLARSDNSVLIHMLTQEHQTTKSASGQLLGNLRIEQKILPLPQFADNALAVSPFVLPKVPAHVRQFWTFKPIKQAPASLPVMALQIYALQAYDAWRQLWREVDPEIAQQLPPQLQNKSDRRLALSVGSKIKKVITENPDLPQQLRDTLTKSQNTPETKQLLSALIDLYAGPNSRFLNFYGGPRTLQTIEFHRLFEDGNTLPDLRGKALFVGFSETYIQSQRDGFLTAFSQENGQDLAGVEIAATAFANLLRGENIQPLSPLAYWSLILAWGIFLAALCLLRLRLALPLLTLMVIGYFSGVYYTFITFNLWLPLTLPLLLQVPVALVALLAWHYRDSSRRRQQLKAAFSYYLPPEVVQHYSDQEQHLEAGGKLTFGICMFSDAAQYTRLAEDMDPTALGDLINNYYSVVFAPVRQQGGIISDVIGDAMLALWTAEKKDHTLALQACNSALTIARETDRTQSPEPHRLPTRIGLHAGPILLGNVGAGDHFEYRAVGDTVNTATRIEGLNKLLGTQLLATEAVIKDVPGIHARPVGQFILVGKTKAQRVYELLCPTRHNHLFESHYLDDYQQAMMRFEQGEWREAKTRFTMLLERQPEDGPCRYYHMLSSAFIEEPPQQWEGVIHLEHK